MKISDQVAYLNSILDSSTKHSIIAKDLKGNIIGWNKGAEIIYGYTAEEVIGKDSAILSHSSEISKLPEIYKEVKKKGSWSGEIKRKRKNGKDFNASVTITLRKNQFGKAIGFTLISHDLSETGRILAKLKQSEVKLHIKNKELEHINHVAQEASRMKNKFIANVSHEFRTPLNGIIGFSELLYYEKLGILKPDQKEYLGDILSSAKHLLSLINDVLDLSKLEVGKMIFKPAQVNINTLVESTRDLFRNLIINKKVDFRWMIHPRLQNVFLDPSKLKQVLYNYTSNALKFTPPEGVVTIKAFPLEDNLHFRLEVTDTGIGIAKKDLGKLFVEFQQLDSEITKKYQGTGLGLALTKQIIEAQGGFVGVHSKLGEGSTFYAVLPMTSRVSQEVINNPQQTSLHTKNASSVLIIEDDFYQQKFLSTILENANYSVDIASTGKEALKFAKKNHYDAITLDLLLPDMNGWDLLKKIKKFPLNKKTPLIVISQIKEKEAVQKSLIDDFLLKPVKTTDFLNSLTRLNLNKSQLPLILLIDNSPELIITLKVALEALGTRVISAKNVIEGLELAFLHTPDLIIMDFVECGNAQEFIALYTEHSNFSQPIIIWSNDFPNECIIPPDIPVLTKSKGIDALLCHVLKCLPQLNQDCPKNSEVRNKGDIHA